MASNDWREVYREERRRPGYVLENGGSLIKRNEDIALKPEVKARIQEKSEAA